MGFLCGWCDLVVDLYGCYGVVGDVGVDWV